MAAEVATVTADPKTSISRGLLLQHMQIRVPGVKFDHPVAVLACCATLAGRTVPPPSDVSIAGSGAEKAITRS